MSPRRTQLPPALLDRAFTTAQARAAGVSMAALKGPSVHRVARSVYVAAGTESLSARAEAVLEILPQPALIAGLTALQIYGVDIGPEEPLRYCTSASKHCRRPNVHVARVRQLPPRRGHLVAPADALVQAADKLDLVQVVTAGDWLLRLKVVDLSMLTTRLTAARGRGCRIARQAASLVRRRVDSPRESWLRMALVLCGLPTPDVNPPIGTEFRFVGFVDLVYRKFQVLVEYEGDQHRSKGQWNSDIGRYEELAAEGWIIIRITAAAARQPRSVVYRVHEALVSRGYAGPAPVFDDQWEALFQTIAHRVGA